MLCKAIDPKKKLTLSRKFLRRKSGYVILSIEEYTKLCERITPVYYLKEKSAQAIDKLYKEGMKEYYSGKCKTLKSLSELD